MAMTISLFSCVHPHDSGTGHSEGDKISVVVATAVGDFVLCPVDGSVAPLDGRRMQFPESRAASVRSGVCGTPGLWDRTAGAEAQA
ncbi:Nut Family Member 1 [Manis pentadactyla]|nr:Nut Family Member 1 [Manis pentadactyla]